MLSRRRSATIKRLRGRKTRKRERLVLVEGARAVGEAIAAGASLRFTILSPKIRETAVGRRLLLQLEDVDAEITWIEDGEWDELSDVEAPQGVMAVCDEPTVGLASVFEGREGILVLDGVQDPGNVGTLTRVAASFGLGGVVALPGTADPWGAKAVRASAGSVFRTRVLTSTWTELAGAFRDRGVRLLVADTSGSEAAPGRPAGRWALVVGNEGRGSRPEVIEGADAVIRVPMPGGGESLNAGVAGSILLYLLTQGVGPEGGRGSVDESETDGSED